MNVRATITVLIAAAWMAGSQDVRGQSNGTPLTRTNVRYPTMMDMTFPEFEAAAKRTDIVLLPVGAIEEHGPYLPLSTDAIGATATLFHVQSYLRKAGVETILGPPLNIGITYHAGDDTRAGINPFPGNLTVSKATLVTLYIDVLRSLHDNGMRRAFLRSGHGGTEQAQALVTIAEEARRRIPGMQVFVIIGKERRYLKDLPPSSRILEVENERNFELAAQLLGRSVDAAPTVAHSEGQETSITLYFDPGIARPGYQNLPQSTSAAFIEANSTGDRSKNPSGIGGGFPLNKASAEAGRRMVEDRAQRIGDAILQVLKKP